MPHLGLSLAQPSSVLLVHSALGPLPSYGVTVSQGISPGVLVP